MASVQAHVEAIHELFQAAEIEGLPLWLGNGWAIDALLGTVRREHEDIDVVYPIECQEQVEHLLQRLGYEVRAWTDYGFIAQRSEVELDMDRCIRTAEGYTFVGYPDGCCPLVRNGTVAGMAVRCTTWDALYLEMLVNQHQIPASDWRPKDYQSLEIIAAHVSEERQSELQDSL